MEPLGRRGGVPHRGPSQAEVAARAGVSAQTVSRVANGHDNVDPATRDRVLAAMRELGYRRNRSAVALRSGRHATIGVVMFALGSFGNLRTWEALVLAADRAGLAVTLVLAERRTREAVRAAFGRVAEQSVDGIVVLLEEHFLDVEEMPAWADLPVVVVDSAGRSGLPFVDTDQGLGARQATEHLLGLGHATVWHVAGPVSSYAAERRERSWRETLERAGRAVPEVERGDWTAASGYRAGRALCARSEVTAVFAANDQMALGVLRALHEQGIPVPHRVSVVGFDDAPDVSEFWPPLTTVHQDFDAVGAAAVALLQDRLDRRAAPAPTIVPTRLVVRESTARPREGTS